MMYIEVFNTGEGGVYITAQGKEFHLSLGSGCACGGRIVRDLVDLTKVDVPIQLLRRKGFCAKYVGRGDPGLLTIFKKLEELHETRWKLKSSDGERVMSFNTWEDLCLKAAEVKDD